VVRRSAAQLLSRQQVAALLDALKSRCPSLVQEVSGRFKTGTIQKVLQGLLRERVPVHDTEAILEALCDWTGSESEIGEICEHVRSCLAAALSQQYCGADGKLWCVSLSPELEEEIAAHLEGNDRAGALTMDAKASARITRSLGEAVEQLRRQGRHGVVLCSPGIRRAVSQLVAPVGAETAVLAYNEIEAVEVKTLNYVGSETV
jgi:flagellar biosynthesis protein FlhA